MTVTVTHLTTASDTSNVASISTASISPTAGRLVEVTVLVSAASPAPSVAVSGCGLTWDLVVSNNDSGQRRAFIFRAVGSPTAGALTFTATGNTPTGWAWSVVEFAGLDTSGTNGSGAVVQTAHGRPASATSISVAFPVTLTAGTVTSAAVGVAVQESPTAGAGWAALGATNYASPATGFLSEWANPGQQNIAASWTTASTSVYVGAEYKPAAAGGVTGAGALATAAAALAGSGTLTATGAGSLTASPAAVSGAGTSSVTAAGSLSAAPATLAAAGAASLAGAGSLTATAATLAAAGAVVTGVTGTGTLTATAAALTATGAVTVTGAGGLTAPPAALTATGAVGSASALRDITVTFGPGASRTFTATAASRTFTADPI